ncbi:hypothetical protein LMG28138_05799 [Pararobbsia alpina]|uniref:Uncharacterized protein n=1 Tax=Pararobbsia alpina TaxID=621374 RepID=A0A6S7CCX0_9BURK|nr:hypothetical protein LMG28138_05799 [Pararobbsia alpina]
MAAALSMCLTLPETTPHTSSMSRISMAKFVKQSRMFLSSQTLNTFASATRSRRSANR